MYESKRRAVYNAICLLSQTALKFSFKMVYGLCKELC